MSVVALALLLTAATPAFEARTLDGQTHDGVPIELSVERLTLQTSNGPVSLETATLVGLKLKSKPAVAAKAGGVCVELLDGSVVLGRQYLCRDGRASLTLSDGQTLATPVRNVRTVRMERDSESMAAEWSRLLGMKHNADLLAISKEETLDYHKGVLHDVAEDVVQFDVDGEVLPVKRSKIYGLAYHHSVESELPPPLCRVIDVFGSRWSARALSLDDKLHWNTPTGLDVSLPADQVAEIDFSAGKIGYLSDLTPESVRWTPFFGGGKPLTALEQFYAPRSDCNFDARPLQLAGVQYPKGLALHSRTELTYRVPSGFSRFSAIAGIDDGVRPRGKVRLVIRGDDKNLLETVIAGSDPPQPVDLDLTGIRRLVILVDFGDTLNVGDHLLLCNARITK